METPAWKQSEWILRTSRLLDSYTRWSGRDLMPRSDQLADSQKLYEAPFVVVAHGVESDPLFNYANQSALELWALSLTQILGMPSRQTAEPVHRDERAELLRRTKQHGFIDDYSGIRIDSTGRRFRIHQATVWNVVDEQSNHIGQAAAFSDWTFLNSES